MTEDEKQLIKINGILNYVEQFDDDKDYQDELYTRMYENQIEDYLRG